MDWTIVPSLVQPFPRMLDHAMECIWAPWRGQYVRTASTRESLGSACFFCEGIQGDDDRTNLLVLRRAATVVFLNRYPYNNGHLLVAPRVHEGAIGRLQGADLQEPIETIQLVIDALDRLMRPDGYNVGLNLGKSAGAGVPGHLHWHVVPRWDGDTNFMPVLAESKVIVDSLFGFYDRFLSEINQVADPNRP